ncbi:MAG: glycosyltransferase family 2 protein [Sphingomicrobium sp.]
MTAIAAVVIGRNEGERIEASLSSVRQAGLPTVYADSGSSDGSPSVAEGLGVPVVRLSPERPFSAARGRNEGMAEVLRRWPTIEFVMFLDGDCTLNAGFPPAAVSAFVQHPDCAIVTGQLSERHPEASVYNRLCSIEWRSPPGFITAGRGLGGIMAVRVAAFRAVGGFNEEAIAGEEADFADRLSLVGWSVLKIDFPMATHDAQMLRFSQWWRRTLRGGHAMAHGYIGQTGTNYSDGGRGVRSALFWGFLLPLVVVLLLIPTRGASLLLLMGYVWLGRRTYRHYRTTGLDPSDAWLTTRFILYGKFPEFLGILRYASNRLRGRFHVIDWR